MDELTLNEWIELVKQHPGILRRPLLLTSNHLIVGYNKEEYDGVLRKVLSMRNKYNLPISYKCSLREIERYKLIDFSAI
jgi:arsenate reductase-like glutaredoxin family protein